MYVLLAALSLLFPAPDLSNHWRWASASVNQSGTNPTPVPSPVIPSPTPTPNPVPTPPAPTPTIKEGDDCPNCDKGWLSTDSVAKERCWKCNGDGIANIGDPILTGESFSDWQADHPVPFEGILSQPEGNRISPDLKQETPKEKKEGTGTDGESTTEKSPDSLETEGDPDSKAICYKPVYSDDGYWLWDLEGKKWIRSSKQPPVYKQVATGHWETKTYKVCNGRNCKTYTKQVWVADSPKKVLQPATPRTSYYPVRGSWWSGCRNWQHLTTGRHAGKFDAAYLQKLSWEEVQSLHSDAHENKVKWEYVN